MIPGRIERSLAAARRLLPALALLACLSALAAAEITRTISYQGFLISKANGLPVETPQDITFAFYDVSSGGTPLFTETRCNVPVSKGRYDVEIGSASVATGGIPASVFTDNPKLWLEIQVDPDGNCSGTFEAMTPRIRLQATPYAFNSLYASTASAATPHFAADVIEALPQTTHGAVTISTNLFVQGGISVGNISPGQKLSVAGVVESQGLWPDCSADPANATCGFRFPDGSIQFTATANTIWDVNGPNVFSRNTGNMGIGENNPNPLARLHVSTAAGDGGDILLVSTGTTKLFKVDGYGNVQAIGNYYGNGASLAGVVVSTGGTMTGPLTLAGSTLTVTAQAGILSPKFKFRDNVEISSAAAGNKGGIIISTHVWLMPGAVLYGDGGGLSNVVTLDNTKVSKASDTMTGPLTLGYNPYTFSGSTLTVTGNAFSVGYTTFSILGGNTQLGASGTPSYLARLTVNGGVIVTSSVTAQGGVYATTLNTTQLADLQNVRASTGTFWGYSGPNDASSYSVMTSSGILVQKGKVVVQGGGGFVGDGSGLTNVSGTDSTKLLKGGDTMTGHLLVSPSSVTIFSSGLDHDLALAVTTSAAPSYYSFAVSTAGSVGVQMLNPSAPLSVYKKILVGNHGDYDPASVQLYSFGNPGYINWSDSTLAPNDNQGALGFLTGLTHDFVFRMLGSSPGSGGTEVFRIKTDAADVSAGNSWKFGIGINPTEKFHVGANVLVSTDAASPILYISTTTGGVMVSTQAQRTALTVAGGITAVSSVTALGGFFGDGSGITNLSAGGLPAGIEVSSISGRADSPYGGVVLTSDTYVTGRLAVGEIFTPLSPTHLRGAVTIDQREADGSTSLNFFLHNGGPAYINWSEGAMSGKASLGMPGNLRDLVLTMNTVGEEVFRIKGNSSIGGGAGWKFGIGTPSPLAAFHVAADVFIGTAAVNPALTISTATAYVGISTGSAKEGLHVASSLLVGGTHSGAVLFVSTGTSRIGVGTDAPRALLEVGNGAILANGNNTSDRNNPITFAAAGAGSRLLWLPSASALRAGYVNGTEWDFVGLYSTAFGYRNSATGDYSISGGGFNNVVSGLYGGIFNGHNNTNMGRDSFVGGGENNYLTGQSSLIPGGAYNVVLSSYGFAGGYNNFLDTAAEGTFVWGNDNVNGTGYAFNTFKIATPYVFLIDPSNARQYRVGVRTDTPQAALDIKGDAIFGEGVNRSSFTAEGFWAPHWETLATLDTLTPTAAGQIAGNSTSWNLCVSTGATRGAWATLGSSGATHCQ